MKVETTALAVSHIAEMYCVSGKAFASVYRNKVSGYGQWREEELCFGFYINPWNIGPHLSIDETCLSNGEVWTFLTNKDCRGKKGTLVAALPGTNSHDISSTLCGALGKSLRRKVREITCDLSPSMMRVAEEVFPSADIVNDRFHVQRLYSEAVDEIRTDLRRMLISMENNRPTGKRPPVCSNGETLRQVLARSRQSMMAPDCKWTPEQRTRAKILFNAFPDLGKAYGLGMKLRGIFNKRISPQQAAPLVCEWLERVREMGNRSFRAVLKTFERNLATILNYFNRRATNASAEAFNSKVKIFRAQMKGVRDRDFFLFRLAKLYG